MRRTMQLFADLEVDNIGDPEIQRLLEQLREKGGRSEARTTVETEGDVIHLGAEYPANDPDYTDWLFQVLSQLVSHTEAPSLECQVCDASGDWWSERIYPAA